MPDGLRRVDRQPDQSGRGDHAVGATRPGHGRRLHLGLVQRGRRQVRHQTAVPATRGAAAGCRRPHDRQLHQRIQCGYFLALCPLLTGTNQIDQRLVR